MSEVSSSLKFGPTVKMDVYFISENLDKAINYDMASELPNHCIDSMPDMGLNIRTTPHQMLIILGLRHSLVYILEN